MQPIGTMSKVQLQNEVLRLRAQVDLRDTTIKNMSQAGVDEQSAALIQKLQQKIVSLEADVRECDDFIADTARKLGDVLAESRASHTVVPGVANAN